MHRNLNKIRLQEGLGLEFDVFIDVQTLLAGDMCCFEFSGALDGWSSSQGILYMYIFKCYPILTERSVIISIQPRATKPEKIVFFLGPTKPLPSYDQANPYQCVRVE